MLLVPIAAYIDDLITCSSSFTKCKFNVKRCAKVPYSSEFIVHPVKSVFAPTKCVKYLGFIMNSENMTISLSDVKKQKKSLCTDILNEDFPVIQKAASLLGKISSCFFTVQFWHLHYRLLARDKHQAMKFQKANFDEKVITFSARKDGIYWWLDNISIAFNVILKGNSELALIPDASQLAWGAVLGASSTNGSFTVKHYSTSMF